MMLEYYDIRRMRDMQATPKPPNLRTGEGHGHLRGFNRERPKKGAWAKRHKREKMRRASRKRNRR